MRITGEYILREIAGEQILVPVGDAALKINGLVTLDEVGLFIWKCMENGKDKDAILHNILDEYDVDEERAKNDLDCFIKNLQEAGLIEL